ncbi:MAG: hypothetical protein CMF23_18095 [Ignavibacteriae bacterium]|nr:hypothetical protein [Ignavibacteriota bacterium]|tara:strand:+ start:518 stop:937 length:420 start_codon:yes stop_codon:yes gene_type:complete
MLKLEIKNINTDLNELKKFGKTVGAVFSAIGLFLFLYHKMQFGFYIGGLGILLVLLGFIFPRSLKNPYKIWMTLALVMGFFMSRLILTILFYFVVTPIGLLAKMFRKDFLDRKFNKEKSSYWNYRTKEEYQKVFTERQF